MVKPFERQCTCCEMIEVTLLFFKGFGVMLKVHHGFYRVKIHPYIFSNLYTCPQVFYWKEEMDHHQNATSPKGFLKLSFRRMRRKHSQTVSGQHLSPIIYPEKKGKLKSSKQSDLSVTGEDPEKIKALEHRIDLGNEKSDLLGYEVFSGKLSLYIKGKSTSTDESKESENGKSNGVDAKLTSKAFIWGSHVLHLADVISVSYNYGYRHFTVHAYPIQKRFCGFSCLFKSHRIQKDLCFLASNSTEAIQWVRGFADQQCYINCLPHPMVSSKKQTSDVLAGDPMYNLSYIKCRSQRSVLVILNPRSGHGRSSKVFHDKVEPIFKLAGFKMEVVKTKSAGHAKKLVCSVDFSTYPDGIICIGGDGLVNEVLNGLLGRENQREAISVPIGIIPAGSDNSLVWTILGVRDPISAALTIVKGGLTATDVFGVEWIQTGAIHYGMTVSYFGFLSDVLELSERYQKRFGPLRYFVAGFLKFICLPKYSFELEYLPISKEEKNPEGNVLKNQDKVGTSDFYTDVFRRSRIESLQRASSFSSVDSVMSPSRMSGGGDMDNTGSTMASSEPSDFVRGINPKIKCLSLGRHNVVNEPDEVLRPQPHLTTNLNGPRTRSKVRTDKACSGQTVNNDCKTSWAGPSLYDKEDISSTVSDPGPVWDSEPKWDAEPNWEAENPLELPDPSDDFELGIKKELVPSLEDKWVVKKGQFIGILVCNHSCRTVQSLSSQVVAPKAEHDDNSLDLLVVNGNGKLQLLKFFILLQFGGHLSLPYVDYVKVKSVKIRPGLVTHNGCGIDGELLHVKEQVKCYLLPDQCQLMGRPVRNRI